MLSVMGGRDYEIDTALSTLIAYFASAGRYTDSDGSGMYFFILETDSCAVVVAGQSPVMDLGV